MLYFSCHSIPTYFWGSYMWRSHKCCWVGDWTCWLARDHKKWYVFLIFNSNRHSFTTLFPIGSGFFFMDGSFIRVLDCLFRIIHTHEAFIYEVSLSNKTEFKGSFNVLHKILLQFYAFSTILLKLFLHTSKSIITSENN